VLYGQDQCRGNSEISQDGWSMISYYIGSCMSLSFPSKQHPDPPIPPGELSAQVLGHAASVQNFLYGGFIVSEGLKDALEKMGRPLEGFRNLLDFGCGSTRSLRWFADYGASCRFVGSDISAAAI
jgi:hypothetical protein